MLLSIRAVRRRPLLLFIVVVPVSRSFFTSSFNFRSPQPSFGNFLMSFLLQNL